MQNGSGKPAIGAPGDAPRKRIAAPRCASSQFAPTPTSADELCGSPILTALATRACATCTSRAIPSSANTTKVCLSSTRCSRVASARCHAANVAELVSLAKVRACDTLRLVSNEMIQMHGGIGMTDEHEAGLFQKRARVLETAYGNAASHRERFARLVGL